MKVCLCITGLLRNFHTSLFPFLVELSGIIDIDFFIYTTKDTYDTKFLNYNDNDIKDLLTNKNCKLFAIDNNEIDGLQEYTQRERNIFYQWKKIQLCFNAIPNNKYDCIIRIRPDVQLSMSPYELKTLLSTLDLSKVSIPIGNDIYSKNNITTSPCINDQIAIGNYKIMKEYANFYTYLWENRATRPVISESLLYRYLEQNKLETVRINLSYTLALSNCSVFAICGNSGAGKSTVVNAIQKIFPFDSSIILETDRYHKWERHSKEWKDHTHLHPNANNLEKLMDDTYLLKMGETVNVVDYDHTTGKFTAPISIQPKNYVFLCGLHTLFKENMRDNIDFKLFIDTEEQLNTYWKVRRDTEYRGYKEEDILKTIQKRKQDLENYILPQKQFADCILHISYEGKLESFSNEYDTKLLEYRITIKKTFHNTIKRLLSIFSREETTSETSTTYTLHKSISKESILDFATNYNLFIPNKEDIDSGYLGVLQVLVLLSIFK